jgi:NAD(P)H dehydrogenase (quinone)
MNVCVVLAHPNPKSLNRALADAFVRGAESAGHEARLLDVYRMEFETCLWIGGEEQPVEPDLAAGREAIQWCDHLAFFFPLWCLTCPARLTGFIERGLAAISTRDVDGKMEPLLTGRSARVVYTADGSLLGSEKGQPDPVWFQLQGMLEWSGFAPIELKVFDRVSETTLEQRRAWLAEAEQMAASLD